MKPTVAILLSDKRSGSTLFQTELCKHPDVNHVAYSPHTYFETHHWLKAACILRMPKHLYYGHQPYKGYGSRLGAKQYMIDCIRGNVPGFAIPNDNKKLVFEGWNALCRKFSKPVFFEKSPQYPHHWAALSLILNWVETTEFKVRFIGLIRNPMAVMYSAQKLFHTNPSERQFGWASCYRNILAMREIVGKERFQLIRYEDLISQPKQIFSNICDFLELDFNNNMGNTVHTRSVNKWREDPTFTLQFHESVVHAAMHFGYKRKELHNPPKPGMTTPEKVRRTVIGFLKLTRARLFDRVVKPIMLNTQRRK